MVCAARRAPARPGPRRPSGGVRPLANLEYREPPAPRRRRQLADVPRSGPGPARDAVLFALLTLNEPELAWDLAHELNLNDADAWDRDLKEYEQHDPIATPPIHTRLVEELLVDAGAQNYQRAAKRLRTMRALPAGTPHGPDVDAFIAQLRETHRRRPRLLQEFDRAHSP